MIRKYITILLLVLTTGSALGQWNVTGPNPAWEGSSHRYTFNTSGLQLPTGLNLSFSVTNGTLLNSQTNPYGPVPLSAQVQWNCGATSGSIIVQDVALNINFTYTVSLYSYGNHPSFCGTAQPAQQAMVFAQPPAILSVTDCSPFCTGTYLFTYQWQRAAALDVEIQPYQPDSWADIAGATAADYIPPPPLTYQVMFYRRITRFHQGAQSITLYSAPVTVSFLDYLQPGTLTGPAGGGVAFNTQPNITETPATGGQCHATDYAYSWERSVENGPWQQFGHGQAYPANAPIIGNCRIRRKVACGGEARYTAPLYFTIAYTSPHAENRPYMRTHTLMVPGIYSWAQADALPIGQKVQTTVYLDEWGRPVQEVNRQASYRGTGNVQDPANYQDIVGITVLDGLGRANKSYLPYATATEPGRFKTQPLAEQNLFNNTIAGEPAGNPYTYSQTWYDGSPLNRPLLQKPAGSSWLGNPQYQGMGSDYAVYKATEGVRLWPTVNDHALPVSTGVYADGQLTKSIVRDERGKLLVTYTDRAGLTVLKKVQEKEPGAGLDTLGHTGWLCTYYIYDDYGRLRITVPPKAVEMMIAAGGTPAATWQLTGSMLGNLCFYQQYDAYGNIIVKQSAGAGEIYSVYDQRNRLVMSQDSVQRGRQQWAFSLYDAQDRPVATGLLTDGRNRAAMQAFVDGLPLAQRSVQLWAGAMDTLTVLAPVAGTPAGGGANLCAPCTGLVVNNISYYDGYGPQAQPYEAVTAAQFAPLAPGSHPLPLAPSLRTRDMATGGKIRVLDSVYDDGVANNDRFLATTVYYNEEGLALQTKAQNILGGTDVANVQYGFGGEVLGGYHRHGNPGSAYHGLITVAKTDNDLLRRPVKSYLLVTSTAADIAHPAKYKTIGTAGYDALGRLLKKELGVTNGGITNGQPLEVQDFSYNIQGQLIGINKDYALGSSPHTQWNRRFGIYLGYGPPAALGGGASGQLTGLQWRAQGDNTPRKYEYAYDNLGRLTKADFAQQDHFSSSGGGQWGQTLLNLTSTVTGYDAHGNLLGLKQWGLRPGAATPSLIDDLQYHYLPNSNRLQRVGDQAHSPAGATDFVDIPNLTDYTYDGNGNTAADANRSSQTVYNFLNLPQRTTLTPPNGGTTTTDYVYDAAGSRLAKKVTKTGTNATVTAPPATTYYAGSYVYEGGEPRYILFDGGRLRRAKQYYLNGDSALTWQWDYFITDHLGNLRTVLTEQQDTAVYRATFEPALRPHERTLFANVDTTAFAIAQVGGSEVPLNGGPNGDWCSRLNGSERKTGAAITLKVMAGDKVDIGTQYWYPYQDATQATPLPPDNLLAMLLNTLSTGAAALSGQKAIPGQLAAAGGPLHGAVTSFLAHQPVDGYWHQIPMAHLNWLLLDEQFRYVPHGSGSQQVGLWPEGWGGLANMDMTVPQSGYLFVYVSNVSEGINVFFDNLSVVHRSGPLVEENSYYPHGLKVAALASKAALRPLARYGYQGLYSEMDAETGLNEFALRSYDPQIGRFIQSDPYDVEPGMYNGMGNDPANLTDPSGGAPPDWGRMVDANGVQHAVYDPSIIDNASAAAYAAKNGYASGSYLFKSGPFTSTQFGVRHWLLLQGGGALPTLDASGLLTPLQPMRGEVALPYALQARTTPLAPSFSEAMPTPSGFVPPSILFPAPFVAPQPMVSYLNNPPANYHRTEEQWKAIGEAMDKLALEEKRARWDRESPMGDVPLLGSVGNMFYRWRHGDISGGFGYGGWALVDGASMGVTGLARKGVGTMVSLTEETFTQALLRGVENVGGYSVYGTKGLVGNTFNRNIFLLEASNGKSLSGFRSFVGSLEAEALKAGANKISVYGASVINQGFLNPGLAKRFGYSFEQIGNGLILQKTLIR